MSCYEWEEGEIKIPGRQWKAFAKQILDIQGKTFKEKKCIVFDLSGEATIILDDTAKIVTWSVSENNRAIERARDYLLARVLFRALDKIEWTRGSGGEIVGNDEYNRDSRDSGGGGNYVTSYYGPPRKRSGRRFR